jgi:hypothetical protein
MITDRTGKGRKKRFVSKVSCEQQCASRKGNVAVDARVLCGQAQLLPKRSSPPAPQGLSVGALGPWKSSISTDNALYVYIYSRCKSLNIVQTNDHKWSQNVPKWSPNGSQNEPHGSQMSTKLLRWGQNVQRGALRGTKGAKGAKKKLPRGSPTWKRKLFWRQKESKIH